MEPTAQQNISEARKRLMDELPRLVEEYIDTARAEGTTQAFDRLMTFSLKAVEGLQVQDKKDLYANLPVIHVSFGPGMQLTMDPGAQPADVVDVAATPVPALPSKSPFGASAADAWTLPENPADLLEDVEPLAPAAAAPPPAEVPTEDEQAVLAALAGQAEAMAMPDED